MDYSISLNSARVISTLVNDFNKSAERLASGLMINSAKDSPAGLAVRELLRADIATGRQTSRNISDGISLVQTASGAAGSVSTALVRMKKLAIQASSGTYSDSQKQIMQDEFAELAAEISQVTTETNFNGNTLLGPAGKEIAISVGNGQTITLNSDSFDIDLSGVDLVSDAEGTIADIDTAIIDVSNYQAGLGASYGRLESSLSVVEIQTENIISSESRISDVNIAQEITSMLATKIAIEAATALLVHSASMSETASKLLA